MKPAGTPSFVRLSNSAVKAEFRTQVHAGVEYVIAPFVALVGDIVVEGMTSEVPEFVPAHVLAAAPSGINGRPIVNIHPDNGQGSANTPESWEQLVYGQVFGAEFSDNRLKVECWLNPEQAAKAGQDAIDVIAMVRDGEMVEVSVGAWVWLEDAEGVAPDGSKYGQRWLACVFDHLAVGLQSQGSGKGACSVEAGCGGPRLLSAKQATVIKERRMNLIETLLSKVDLTALADGMSDNELRGKLSRALHDTVPAFQGVAEVYPESSTCIYMTSAGGEWTYYEVAYTLDGEAVTLGRKKQVEPITEWKKVAAAASGEAPDDTATSEAATIAAAAAAPLANTPCQCQHDKGDAMTKVQELAGKLIACTAAPFADTDREHLEALSEAQLTALDEKFAKPAPLKVEAEAVDEPPADTVQLSKTEHADLVRLAGREAKRDRAARAYLVKLLTGHSTAFTETQLATKDADELTQLCALAGIDVGPTSALDYSGKGAHAVTALADPNNVPPPDPWKVPAALAQSLGLTTTQ